MRRSPRTGVSSAWCSDSRTDATRRATATRTGQTLPVKVLFQLRLTDGRYDVMFEDSDRSRWKVSPANFREMQKELQPAFD